MGRIYLNKKRNNAPRGRHKKLEPTEMNALLQSKKDI